jgi:NADPH-dependent 2,4-dienoyl-CoA reductase/sulfur reductase-like enzyme
VPGKQLTVRDADGRTEELPYDALIVGTGAVSVRPSIEGLTGPDALGPADGVHLLHSMGDTFQIMQTLAARQLQSAVVIGAGYIGLEMAEALTTRGLQVTQIEALPEVLPTVDPQLGALVHAELEEHGVEVITDTQVSATGRALEGNALRVQATAKDGKTLTRHVDLALVVVGVRPDPALAVTAGARLGTKGAIEVDQYMRTSLPDVYAAGDCSVTHPRLLGKTWLPLGTTAHKQGRIAGENPRWAPLVHRQPRHPGGQGLRPRRRPHRPARPRSRSCRARLDSGHHRNPPRRPQGVLPRRHANLHPRDRRHLLRAPAGRPTRRTPRRGDLKARGHVRHRPSTA